MQEPRFGPGERRYRFLGSLGDLHESEVLRDRRPAIGVLPGFLAVVLPVFVLIGVPHFFPAMLSSLGDALRDDGNHHRLE
jgi:hypothetical protein